MAAFSVLYPFCLPELPGVPAPMVDMHINGAWKDLAARSLCWSEWKDVAITAGINRYSLGQSSDGGGRVHTVREATFSSNVLQPMSPDSMVLYDPAHAERAGSPRSFNLTGDGQVVLYPIPQAEDAGHPVKLLVAYVPTMIERTIPDRFAEKYGEVISHGVKARLMAMAAPWANPGMAQFYQSQFEAGVTEAVTERLKGGASGPVIVRPRAFF